MSKGELADRDSIETLRAKDALDALLRPLCTIWQAEQATGDMMREAENAYAQLLKLAKEGLESRNPRAE